MKILRKQILLRSRRIKTLKVEEALMNSDEEISEEEAKRLDRLAEEAREKGILWEKVKADLNL